MKNIKLFLILILLFIPTFLFSEEHAYKWRKISGNWEIGVDQDKKYLQENRCSYREYNYSELINFNSIITDNPIIKYDSITFFITSINPQNKPFESILSFSIQDYRDFYAFKFIVSKEKKAEIQFINSSIKDKSLEPKIKNNFEISILKKSIFDFEINKRYAAEIKIENKSAKLFIDSKLILESETPVEINSGRIGFSSRNAKLRIEDVKVYDSEKVVFEDDFSTDLIKRAQAQAKRETPADE
jgi:hypothetical protein